MLKEFREFALKGNAMSLAVGVIIGGAFQAIITSLVDDIIMPFVNIFTGKHDFSELTWQIGESTIKYGAFITAIVDFIIVAFVLFLIVRYLNRLNEKVAEKRKKGTKTEAATTKICPFCQSEISIQATRCPHCTSELHENANN